MQSKIFNSQKSDYSTQGLFLGEDSGLMDTINKKFPKIWKLYKTLKKMDWDENEFDFSDCAVDFKTCSPSIYRIMIKNLAWQWETDTIAARSYLPILAPFISSTEAFAAYTEITKNEIVHTLTYSEIVRNSFDNPEEVFGEILAITESLARLDTVSKVFSTIYKVSHEYALGLRQASDIEVQDAVWTFIATMLCVERLQFMSSFAPTFAVCNTGLFNPIGKAVQKIAQDELEIHVEMGKEVFKFIPVEVWDRIKPNIEAILSEIVERELTWAEYLFAEGDELVGVNEHLLKEWVLFNAKDIYKLFKFESKYSLPKVNPLKFMEKWLDISKTQPSPQEEDNGQYKLNSVRKDDVGTTFEIDF